MNRQELRFFIRVMADELTEAPEGLYKDIELNQAINIAQRKVQMDLIEYIPWYFRGIAALQVTSAKQDYGISTDFSITDHIMFENILRNITGKPPTPLLFIKDPEEIHQYVAAGKVGEPEIYFYKDRQTLRFEPYPNTTYDYTGFYLKKIPDLTHDDSDVAPNVATPHLPEGAHELLALEVLMRWYMRDERSMGNAQQKYAEELYSISYRLSDAQGVSTSILPSIREMRARRNTLE